MDYSMQNSFQIENAQFSVYSLISKVLGLDLFLFYNLLRVFWGGWKR
jgi:hypothetical protein